MSIKAKEAARRKKQNEKLRKMYEDARQVIAGHEEVARIQTACIAILLNKLKATKENPVTITAEEVKEALKTDNVKAGIEEAGVWKLYCEDANE